MPVSGSSVSSIEHYRTSKSFDACLKWIAWEMVKTPITNVCVLTPHAHTTDEAHTQLLDHISRLALFDVKPIRVAGWMVRLTNGSGAKMALYRASSVKSWLTGVRFRHALIQYRGIGDKVLDHDQDMKLIIERLMPICPDIVIAE